MTRNRKLTPEEVEEHIGSVSLDMDDKINSVTIVVGDNVFKIEAGVPHMSVVVFKIESVDSITYDTTDSKGL